MSFSWARNYNKPKMVNAPDGLNGCFFAKHCLFFAENAAKFAVNIQRNNCSRAGYEMSFFGYEEFLIIDLLCLKQAQVFFWFQHVMFAMSCHVLFWNFSMEIRFQSEKNLQKA